MTQQENDRLIAIAKTDTLLPKESEKVRAKNKGCYFPLCFCRDECKFKNKTIEEVSHSSFPAE